MNVLKIQKNSLLEMISFLLFFILIAVYASNRMASIMNISSGLLIIICIYTMIKRRSDFLKKINCFYCNRKLFLIFNLWCVVCILFFTYSHFSKLAFYHLFKEWRYAISVFLFLVVYHFKVEKIKLTVIYAMLLGVCMTIFFWPFFIQNPSDTRPLFIILRNNLGEFIPVFFPFVLSFFIVSKSIYLKVLAILILISTFIFLLYTGSRGGLLSVLIESIIVLYYFSSNIKMSFIRLLSYMILFAGLVLVAYYSIPQFQQKVNQTLENNNVSSSRDLIITSRFPLIVNSTQHLLTGIGYDSVSYNTYLLEHNAPKVVGYYDKQQEYVYNNDEPFFLTMLYNVGLIGLILFIGAFFINLKDIYKGLKEKKDIFNVSFMAFGIGYFLIFCSFELVSMRLFFLFSVLSILCLPKIKEKN